MTCHDNLCRESQQGVAIDLKQLSNTVLLPFEKRAFLIIGHISSDLAIFWQEMSLWVNYNGKRSSTLVKINV